MAVIVKVKFELEIIESYAGDLGPRKALHQISKQLQFTSGNGSSQFDKAYSDEAAATTDYDVAGVVTDAQGAAITMSKLGLIYAENESTTSGAVMNVGGDANSVPIFGAAADFMKLGPQGWMFAINPVDGWTVTGSTGDVVEINHATGTFDHKVILAGRS